MKRFIWHFYTVFLTFALLFIARGGDCHAQLLTNLDSVEISLLTCEPHEEVYSLYGHTALRVHDPSRNMDVAVNYGVFDQRKPNFLLRFVFGLTDYTMEFYPMSIFLNEYIEYGSAVTEQILNLTNEEKEKILIALDDNYRPENREYRYNYFYNNCTTKARDIIVNNIVGKVIYQTPRQLQRDESFRELIHWKNDGYDWCAAGNDLLLGMGADVSTTTAERQFLPEILMNDFDFASIISADGAKRPLVKATHILNEHGENRASKISGFVLTPTASAMLLLLIISIITICEGIRKRKRLKWLDNTLFMVMGILGLLLFAMIFSEHPTVRANLQILLFSPLWLVLPWFFNKKPWTLHLATTMLALFFLGNIVQTYAEGTNILALCLLVRLGNIYYDKK